MYIYILIFFHDYRSWLEVAIDEKKRRGPWSDTKTKKEIKCYQNWNDIKKEMIEYFTLKPTLCIFFIYSTKKELDLQSTFDLTYMLIYECHIVI